MKHLAAYLLLVLGGNDSPTAKDIKNVLDSVGIEADDDRIKKLLGEVKGKDLNDVCFFFSFHFFLHAFCTLRGSYLRGVGKKRGEG